MAKTEQIIPYKSPRVLFSNHLETIYPALLRKVAIQPPAAERIITPDDDFLDLDWYKQGSEKCLVISHGLEGNSSRAYVKGMAKAFLGAGFDVFAWNYRGCSGETNRQLRFYHSGATDDLQFVVSHVAKEYSEIYLLGFSLGGNLTLKYLGEPGVHPAVRKAVTFSTPVDLHSSCLQISKPSNWVYTRRFLNSLVAKVRTKAAVRDDLDVKGLEKLKTLFEFDDHFTGPIHGFRDAIDYYTKSSSIHFIKNIRIPTLVVNALNDPFLSPECYPRGGFGANGCVGFEYPERGGHVGFALFNHKGLYWSEMRALSFILNT
jgi:predicted alpha/beta-fold hydrolase